jgi:hypothetical protein
MRRWLLRRAEPRPGPEPRADAESGSAVVEFVLVTTVALVLTLALAQLALFLFERNVLLGSLAEGARVAAAAGRTVGDGQARAAELLSQSAGGLVADKVAITGQASGDLVVLHAAGTLPSFVPFVPGLPVRLTASMHKEELL